MYHILNIQINKDDELFHYCDQYTKLANNLYNAALFVYRQVFASSNATVLNENEKAVFESIANTLPLMNEARQKANEKRAEKAKLAAKSKGKNKSNNESKKQEPKISKPFEMPGKEHPFLTLEFLDAYFKASKNADYFAPIPRQSAQNIIKSVIWAMKSFFMASRDYKLHPEKYIGKPKIPGYHKKQGNTTITLSNQDCVIRNTDKGEVYTKLPMTNLKCILPKKVPGKLIEVRIVPHHGVFTMVFVFKDNASTPKPKKEANRACAIDLGVDNFAAITNNIGEPCLLFKGGVVKSINQWYNKRTAEIVSAATKGSNEKFEPTEEFHQVALCRNNVISDYMHKTAKYIITWCTSNHIDTIVVGVNHLWKQKTNMGHVNNQEFVQIPYYQFRRMLKYLAEQEGIRYVEHEESYTSKASYLDNDYIPVFGVDDAETKFSGRRAPTAYISKNNYKCKRKSGFRGLYRTKEGKIINSDLNGSANIGRKALPGKFENVDFDQVIIIQHPDYDGAKANKKNQLAANQETRDANHPYSKSKMKRLAKKHITQ